MGPYSSCSPLPWGPSAPLVMTPPLPVALAFRFCQCAVSTSHWLPVPSHLLRNGTPWVPRGSPPHPHPTLVPVGHTC